MASYRIVEDEPGEVLALQWEGPLPYAWLRRSVWLLGLVLFAGAVVVLQQFVGGGLRPAAGQPPDLGTWGLLGVLAVMAFITALQVMPRLSDHFGQDVALRWDAATGQFEVRRAGMLPLWRRRTRIPLPYVRRMALQIGPTDTGAVPFALQVYYNENPTDIELLFKRVELQCEVEGIDSRVKAVDLLFRAARIVGLDSFLTLSNDVLLLDVQAVNSSHQAALDEDDDEDEDGEVLDAFKPQPIPPYRGPDVGVKDLPWLATDAGDTPVKFDSAPLADRFAWTRLVQWEPGHRVCFVREAAPPGTAVVLVVFGAGIGALLAAWPFYRLMQALLRTFAFHDVGRLVPALIGGVIGAAVLMWLMWRRLPQRELVFDWESRQVFWRHGKHAAVVPFSEVQSLQLSAVQYGRRRPVTPELAGRSDCGARVTLRTLDGREELIIESDIANPQGKNQVRFLFPLAQNLAQAMGVPWQWYRGDAQATRRPMVWLLAGIVLSAIAGSFYVRYQDRQAEKLAMRHAEETAISAGGNATFLDGYTFQNIHKVERFFRVDLPGKQPSEEQWRELMAALKNLPRVGLDLSGTRLSAERVRDVSQLRGLVWLSMALSNVDDDMLEPLFHLSNVEFLNLSTTRAGDHAISTVAMIGKLRVLLAVGTRVTDDGFINLRVARALKYVDVSRTPVTARGVAALRGSLPSARIEGGSR